MLAGTFGSYLNEPSTVATLEVAPARMQACGLPVNRLQVNGWRCLAANFSGLADALQSGDRPGAPERTVELLVSEQAAVDAALRV